MIKLFKKRFFVLVFCLISFFIIFYHVSRPIIRDPSQARIHLIQYNPNFGQEGDDFLVLNDYNAQTVLDCFNCYEERFSWTRVTNGGWMGDVSLLFLIDSGTPNGTKVIVLGTDNYSYATFGAHRYNIRNAEALKNELYKLLLLTPTS